MNDFFDKLNTLIRVKLSDLLGENKSPEPSSSQTPMQQVARDAENLRKRIDDAIDYEQRLQSQIDEIKKQLLTLQRQADDAIQKSNEAMARYFIEKIDQQRNHLATLEKDLREHRHLAQGLIEKVNTLEATIAEIQSAKETSSQQKPQSTLDDGGNRPTSDNDDIEADLERRRNRLSKK